jgi:hypothetical protein
MGVLGGFIGNSSMDPADARPPMRGLGTADFSSEEPTISIHRTMRRVGRGLPRIRSCAGSVLLFPTLRRVTLSSR